MDAVMDEPHFNGPAYDPAADQERLTHQHERIKALMLDGAWRTLDEIATVTGDPPASVSAQLRHLRKERFGSWIVERRPRERASGLWEYQLLAPDSAAAVRLSIPDKETMYAALLDLREVVRLAQQSGRQPSKELIEVGRWMACRVSGEILQRGARQ